MRLLVTLALDAPDDADPQGIKEKVAMDFEKYGGVRVVKVERVEEYRRGLQRAGGDRHADGGQYPRRARRDQRGRRRRRRR